MASAVEKLYGVPLPHEALLRAIGEQYGAEAEQVGREVYAQASRRYQRAAKARAEKLWLERRVGRLTTPAMERRAEKARQLLEDPMAYIDGGE
jgi:hypothetical protein